MTLGKIIAYWVGNSQAIRDIAVSRSALWLGAFLVLTAGIGRRYDQYFILENPFGFVSPLLASLISSWFIFVFLYFGFIAWKQTTKKDFWAQYRSFLGLYWMTAPIAWLYAIPGERFLDSYSAAVFNFSLLGLVALWRVLLISRAISVVVGIPLIHALILVLLPSSILVFVISFFTVLSNIPKGMGGLEFSPEEKLIGAVMSFAMLGALVVGALTLVGRFLAFRKIKQIQKFPLTVPSPLPIRAMGLVALAWIGMAIYPQIEVWRSYRVDQLVHQDQWSEALAFMSQYAKQDFFPARPLPPDPYQYGFAEGMARLLSGMKGNEAQWVQEYYWNRLAMVFQKRRYSQAESFSQIAKELGRLPQGKLWVEQHMPLLREFFAQYKSEEWPGGDKILAAYQNLIIQHTPKEDEKK